MAAVKIVKIEDHEDNSGHCGHCQREGLRWIVILSDGRAIGTECAKKIMGHSIPRAKYVWIADFTPVAEHSDGHSTFVMWVHKTGTQTRETQDGRLVAVGGIREDWERKGRL